jgi:hypothetical protein
VVADVRFGAHNGLKPDIPPSAKFLTQAPQQNASCDMPATFGLPSTADMALRRENWRYAPRID